jgi:hypothetical protein
MSALNLIFKGRKLEDEIRLSDAGLEGENLVHVVIKHKDRTLDSFTSADRGLFEARGSQVVWSLVYLDKTNEAMQPFEREILTINTASTLSEVIAAYEDRKKSGHPDRIPYIAATVMPANWREGVITTSGDKSSGGLPYLMNSSGESFNRPVLALYSFDPSVKQFTRIQNPLYAGKGLSTSSAMAFEAAFHDRFAHAAPVASAPSTGAGVGSAALPSAAPAVSVETASSERLNYIARHIADNVRRQIQEFSSEGMAYAALSDGVRLAIQTLLTRYQDGPVSAGPETMTFFTGLSNDLAQEICSAIAPVVEHPNTPGISGLSSQAVFSAATEYLNRLASFSFEKTLEYLELMGVVSSPEAASAPASSVPAGAGRGVSEGPAGAGSAARPAPTKLIVLDVEGTIRDSAYDHKRNVPFSRYQNIVDALGTLTTQGCEIVLATGLKNPGLVKLKADLDTQRIGQYISRLQPRNASGSAEGESKANKIQSYLQDLRDEGREIFPGQVFYFDDLLQVSTQAEDLRALGINFYTVNNLDRSGHDLTTFLTKLASGCLASSPDFYASFSDPVGSASRAGEGAFSFPGGAYGGSRDRADFTPSAPPVSATSEASPAEIGTLKTQFVLAFMSAYEADSKGHMLGSLFRNTTFPRVLNTLPTIEEKFESIKSHYMESEPGSKPSRTAVVVQKLLKEEQFSDLNFQFARRD